MAEADFTELTGVLNSSSVVRGVSQGITPPNGGGSAIYGFNALVNTTGVVARHTNLTNFSPAAKGADVSIAMQRGTGGGQTGWAAMLFCCLGGVDVGDVAYILGLSDADPGKIVLRKGALNIGLPDSAVGSGGVLAISTDTIAIAEWVHLRLEVVVNVSGDVVINVYRNADLATNDVTSPVWTKVPGMSDFVGGAPGGQTAIIDDVLGVNTGSLPFTSGRAGYGMHSSSDVRRAYFDHHVFGRQL